MVSGDGVLQEKYYAIAEMTSLISGQVNLVAQRSGTNNASSRPGLVTPVLKVNGPTLTSNTNSSSNNNNINLNINNSSGNSGNNNRLSLPAAYRSSLGGFVNVGNVSVPISVASAVFNGTPVYNSQVAYMNIPSSVTMLA